MIVWLNGAFGAGKTTTAHALTRLLPRARVFDPEQVGFLLRHVLPEPPGDFQHLPPWRPLVTETAVRVLAEVGGVLVAPQTVLVREYLREIFDGFAAARVPVRHVLLHADEPELRRRIDGDVAESARARAWRLEHVAAYREALPWLRTSADVVDTVGRAPDRVAAEVARTLPR
ncbi:shikimate kinase [Prauserella shujinwangii]|uniref:Shikimate kinase n=1 Tax=Prauserella shujinwangii TaxID=1453103 RepID=A0A2T0LYF6_9PSEU|nr:AAA family ATPase [Prauserella shujinwangii]PRX49151.1 shikimate kinase [Prauserella shujinwangii]